MIFTDRKKFLEIIIALILILAGALLRILPHPDNFAPISAIALFGAVYLSKRVAFFAVLAAMVVSDIFIGYYELKLMAVVYGSFLLCVFVGFWLKKNKKWYTILESSFLAALIFFILTNFAVWLFTPWYEKSLAGIIQCYFLALPFFKNTLLGNLFYTSVFFSSYELIKNLIRIKVGKKNIIRQLINQKY